MYQIKCDDYILHDARLENTFVISPKCTMQIGKTGSLTFKIHPKHPHYDKIQKLKSEIKLYQDDELIFCGRVLNDEIDFNNFKNIECEGALAYLLDGFCRPSSTSIDEATTEGDLKNNLERFLYEHNNSVNEERKQFELGEVTMQYPTDNVFELYFPYQSLMGRLNDFYINKFGGYLRVRYENDKKYLDYLYDITDNCSQTIEFGKNITNLTKYIKGEDIYTALIPLGEKLYDESDEKDIYRLTIDKVNDGNYGELEKLSSFIYSQDLVDKYGWVYKIKAWDDIDDQSVLFHTAWESFTHDLNEPLTLELTVVDLHLINSEIDKISVGDNIRVISKPHDLDTIMVVNKMEIDIDKPGNTKIILTLPSNFLITDNSYSENQNSTNNEITNVKELISNPLDTSKFDNKYMQSTGDIKSVEQLKAWTDNTHLKVSPTDTIKSVADVKDWTSNNHLKLTPSDGIKSVGDIKNWANDNFLSKTAGGDVDLSQYAKIVDVNNAFNQLANALGGI